MICKFCGEERALIKAHIIPAVFFRRIHQGQSILQMITDENGAHPKRAPLGVYDKTIVCQNCENIWRDWDNYAQKLLADEPLNGKIHYHGGRKLAYVVDTYEYDKLKLFFISMIWRASVSSQKFFSKVSLGEFENIAKEHITKSDPGDSETFSITIAKFDHPLSKSILDPDAYNHGNVHYFRFYLADYIAYIKVDNKPTPKLLSYVALSKNTPLLILCRDFINSKELNLMKNLVNR